MSRLRMILIAPALALGLLGAGCAPGVNGGPPTIEIPTIDPGTVTQIQTAATQICGFVPTVATVLNIITTFTGGSGVVAAADQIAQGICGAVTAKGARLGARGGPRYRGVALHGSFKH